MIPKDKNYPDDSVQCDDCGGFGCVKCNDKGWLAPKNHPAGRKCFHVKCSKPLHPAQVAVYCTNDCAISDA